MNTQITRSNLFDVLNANAMFSFTSGLFFLLARKLLEETACDIFGHQIIQENS